MELKAGEAYEFNGIVNGRQANGFISVQMGDGSKIDIEAATVTITDIKVA